MRLRLRLRLLLLVVTLTGTGTVTVRLGGRFDVYARSWQGQRKVAREAYEEKRPRVVLGG